MMASKTFTDAIALTEKKMDMTLDDIIKMSKKPPSKGRGPPRTSNKNRGFLGAPASHHMNKVQSFLDSRSTMRQGTIAQKRSNFQGYQFPSAKDASKQSAAFPIRNSVVGWNKRRAIAAPVQRNVGANGFAEKGKMENKQKPSQTLDARFADIMKEQRKTTQQPQRQIPRGSNNGVRSRWRRRRQQQQQQQQAVRVAS